jgi:hypothetical protein
MSISAWVSIGRTNLRADAPIVVSADFTPATAASPTQPSNATNPDRISALPRPSPTPPAVGDM